jgi:hypothetical protein
MVPWLKSMQTFLRWITRIGTAAVMGLIVEAFMLFNITPPAVLQ